MLKNNEKIYLRVLQVAVIALLAGRGWQHLFWDAPYRVLLWDENLMSPIVKGLFGWSWAGYSGSREIDRGIAMFIKGMGVFYLLSAILVIFIERWKTIGRFFLLLSGFSLIFLALLYSKDRFWQFGQFWEYSLQFGSPLFLYWYLSKEEWEPWLVRIMLIATALTFTCHGLYAIGFYPRPGLFLTMTMTILDFSETQAITFLVAAGLADFAASIMLFFKGIWRAAALAYCVLWGLATSAARIWAHFQPEWWSESLMQWLHETVLRFPHFLIPLLLLLLFWEFPQLALRHRKKTAT